MWKIIYTGQARKDANKLATANLKKNAESLLATIQENPYQNPPPYKKLSGDLAGYYSRRINIHNRLVYQILEEDRIIKVIRLWGHYK